MDQFVSVTLSPGMRLYKYKLISRIGQGSFGEVWRANELALQREFAVKILKPGISVDERLREARIGNRLAHSNLVHVHQADVLLINDENVVVLAMDYHPNGAVETLANPVGFVPLPYVLRVARDILQGLDYLHVRNFFHNDIKPGNILIGKQQEAMLSDYGITGVSDDGTPVTAPSNYLRHRAPEVRATGNISVSSDIFQVGMTLAELLLGLDHFKNTWTRVGREQYERDMSIGKLLSQKDFPSHIPAAVRRIILKAINPIPTQRYSSSLAMRRAIEKLNFRGHWNVDASDKEFGTDDSYRYEYQRISVAADRFDLVCTKSDIASGKAPRRITKYCQKRLTSEQTEKAVAKFKSFVVTGR